MKILLIGNGAREHVIAETLIKSSHKPELIVYAKVKNPGISELSSHYEVTDSLTDLEHLKELVRKIKPDFAIIGPEEPIAHGVSDFLGEMGVPCVAPLKDAAKLESSKSFARELVDDYGISGNPRKIIATKEDDETTLLDFVQKLKGEFVVKADSLRSGKGVKVAGDHFSTIEEGLSYAKKCIQEDGKVVVEEKLVGQEFSLMSFVDGKNVIDMPPVQDHKRAFEGDKGPNTGGMGSYCQEDHLLPFLQKNDLREAHMINQQVCEAVYQELGIPFKGIMYGGFMLTEDGIRLLEYNVRFGDPEAMNVLPLLKSDFVEVCQGILHGDLNNLKIEFEHKASVCKYIVPEGYPDNPAVGGKIQIGSVPMGVRLYYASLDQKEDGLYMTSSRAIAIVGIADTISEAEKLAEMGTSNIHGRVYHRSDIGTKEVLEAKKGMFPNLSQLV